ncbi:hypothetical protein [Shiella aurantiaca]|uniref:hypothetical protein n=1 Tax=Shiella aurantiaca TaxID=3058365 RepID=UPI0029F46725|nr:hypothetical protein [Shiella aurantiaca]
MKIFLKLTIKLKIYRLNKTVNAFNTVIPWVMYSGMTEQDLGAIYEYLQSLAPVENKVERLTALK